MDYDVGVTLVVLALTLVALARELLPPPATVLGAPGAGGEAQRMGLDGQLLGRHDQSISSWARIFLKKSSASAMRHSAHSGRRADENDG